MDPVSLHLEAQIFTPQNLQNNVDLQTICKREILTLDEDDNSESPRFLDHYNNIVFCEELGWTTACVGMAMRLPFFTKTSHRCCLILSCTVVDSQKKITIIKVGRNIHGESLNLDISIGKISQAIGFLALWTSLQPLHCFV